ncbi:hypothetical protein DOTSEDRAFT_30229 [Dothistroma septosporum NZE10]|uniref:Zn(2)-C6 fungal-type domain-containing protein n=1 Tax=Dothistroma septosporum (strain NZE10 / CBS 128990) TaxID=675120 RepID=N1Q2I4_DOTSN|nr:hypothetical protein DOTSEDRAFT_30229 [Dothistroma septosporum NZE10]
MTTTLPSLEPAVLAECSTRIQTEDQDPGTETQRPSDVFTSNMNGTSNMDVDWDAWKQKIKDDDTLPPTHEHSPEDQHDLKTLCDMSAVISASDEEDGADSVEPPHGLDADDLELPRRELRPQHREKRTFATTWVDNDETGNYDPVEEERNARQKRAKLRAAAQQRFRRDSVETTSEGEVIDQLTEDLIDEVASEPAKLLMSFNLTSQRGKAAFTVLLNKLAVEETSEKAGYKLRKRSKLAATPLGSTQNGTNGISTKIDLSAKPFARGCWGCTTTGTCSLLHDERQWPCQTCLDDDMDCELIIQPTRKRACEMCKRRKIACSYNYTRNHGVSCEQCQSVGQRCIAGRAKEFLKPRVTYDRDWEADPLPKRRGGKQQELEECLECVGAGRPCAYPARNYGSPCEDCTDRGLACTITSNVPAENASSIDSATLAGGEYEKATSSEVAPILTKPRSVEQARLPTRAATAAAEHRLEKTKGTQRKIYTCFSHPITFNCDLEGDQDSSCHFCTEPALPKLGFGTLHPEVVDWSDGRGFDEIRNGHIEKNQIEKTRLCYAYTSSRLAIVTCYRHKLDNIISRSAGLAEAGPQSCHICNGTATYGCIPSDGHATGCGLELCRPCAVTLSRDHSGHLGKMLGKLADFPEDPHPRTLRADCEFLREDGHIARYLKFLDTQ